MIPPRLEWWEAALLRALPGVYHPAQRVIRHGMVEKFLSTPGNQSETSPRQAHYALLRVRYHPVSTP